ncbi:MAG: beta-glucosidase BglX, partial [Lachnospiraceae bacterium]|nr:beta-glucosidase BglX [Lachnospiraceae bacterium]
PHHIPMLFMLDVIHGMKTVFPMPLAQGAAFDPEMSEKCAAAAALEAAVSGLHVTFSPMADLVRDARWGRVMESNGEDPYLNSLLTAAQVKGFQGEDMGSYGKVCSCVKHFAGYGAAEAGRDYNTTQISERTFREFYLKAYQAGIDAGAGMVMTSFNTVNDIPASTNQWLMRDVLRGEMGFDGVLISDYAAILETVAHGYSEDEKHAAENGLKAGVDIDMMTNVYAANLADLVREGTVSEEMLDESVWRVLELKNKLGLFENPYKDADPEAEKKVILCQEHRALAREAAARSFVLLKNDGVLPVDPSAGQKVAFIGPYVNRKQIISSWSVAGDTDACVTIQEAAMELFDPSRTVYLQGSPVLDPDYEMEGFFDYQPEEFNEEQRREMLQQAAEAAEDADLVILAMGEHYLQSGEATSRSALDLPQVQMELLREVAKVNKNIAVVLFNGRPLDLREISQTAGAVLEVWLPGTEGGHAVIDVLTGRVNPSGKLSMSFPYCVGQVPVYYNRFTTGRPCIPGVKERFKSKYLDIPNEPLYPFGYGLSYTEFEFSPVALDSAVLKEDSVIRASVTVKNTGDKAGTEVVQLYLQDVCGSVVRPKKELKGFRKVTLAPGESEMVEFVIDEPMLRFLRADGTVGSEPGQFRVWIADSSASGESLSFCLE